MGTAVKERPHTLQRTYKRRTISKSLEISREALAAQYLQEILQCAARLLIGLAFIRAKAKIAPSIDDLLGGTAALHLNCRRPPAIRSAALRPLS